MDNGLWYATSVEDCNLVFTNLCKGQSKSDVDEQGLKFAGWKQCTGTPSLPDGAHVGCVSSATETKGISCFFPVLSEVWVIPKMMVAHPPWKQREKNKVNG